MNERADEKEKEGFMKKLIQMLIAPTLLALASSAAAGQGKVMPWTIGSDLRHALVFAPTVEPPGEKHPVIFAFHGHGGNMETPRARSAH